MLRVVESDPNGLVENPENPSIALVGLPYRRGRYSPCLQPDGLVIGDDRSPLAYTGTFRCQIGLI